MRVCALALSAVFTTAGTAAADVATGGTTAPGPAATTTTQGPATSEASGLDASPRALKDRRQRVRGKVASTSGTPVSIQLAGTDGHWATVARTVAGGGGSIDTIWRPRQSGRFTLRAVPTAASSASAASSATAAPTAAVTVYATAIATEYGPQAGDRRAKPEATACGPNVTATTLGVAHRTLPCGTLVELYYRGHTVTVPVIDRGPYANGASWDLTYATARALHFNGLDRIGSVVTGSVKLPTR